MMFILLKNELKKNVIYDTRENVEVIADFDFDFKMCFELKVFKTIKPQFIFKCNFKLNRNDSYRAVDRMQLKIS